MKKLQLSCQKVLVAQDLDGHAIAARFSEILEELIKNDEVSIYMFAVPFGNGQTTRALSSTIT
jgi:hypothetical protein